MRFLHNKLPESSRKLHIFATVLGGGIAFGSRDGHRRDGKNDHENSINPHFYGIICVRGRRG
jgi:hypothetical protein